MTLCTKQQPRAAAAGERIGAGDMLANGLAEWLTTRVRRFEPARSISRMAASGSAAAARGLARLGVQNRRRGRAALLCVRTRSAILCAPFQRSGGHSRPLAVAGA
jgi:hypothetical protein